MSALNWPERLRALYKGNRVLSPSLHHELADHLESLDAEIERLNARLDAAHEALAIDEFDGDSCTTLETTIEYAVHHYRLVCDSEAAAADEIQRLRAEVSTR